MGQEVKENSAAGASAGPPDPVVLADPSPPKSAYQVPPVPETGWSSAQSRRRIWVGRALLLGVLVIQAALSLRLHNTAFEDEALYLYAGQQEVSHLLHGTPLMGGYANYFSGSPWLYPVLAGAVNMWLGLTGARLLSLAFMLGCTVLLYALTRRLFNERVALCAVALYAVLQPTIVLGYFATYDAPALFLTALAAWIVVRLDRAPPAAVLLAAPVAVLAALTKYAAALFVPTVVLLAVIVAWRHQGPRALLRGLLLVLGIGVLLLVGVLFGHVFTGVQATTTARAQGTDSLSSILAKSAQWGGGVFAVACGGAVAYVWRERMFEAPTAQSATSSRRWRAALAALLCATALLAPAYQAHLHTSVSLFKHMGFGLWFAAPVAGVGITRLVGAHFRQPQLGILAWVVLLALGISQSTWRYSTWPNSAELIAVLRQHVNGQGRYLTEAANVPTYYLSGVTSPDQWTTTYNIDYVDPEGVTRDGDDGYRAAIQDGYFNLVVLDGETTPDTDRVIKAALMSDGQYRLIARLPYTTAGGPGAYLVYQRE